MRWYFRLGQTIKDPHSRQSYRIEGRLGRGGFGQAYRAEHLTPGGRKRAHGNGTVCLKVTGDPIAWHGEAYFGLLTQGLANVVEHFGSFPLPVRGGMRFVLVMELMSGGTVADWLRGRPRPWTTGQVTNALRPLARTLGALHSSGASHRDITPMNVFVGKRKSLYLGDFGIAKHGLRGRGPQADAFNQGFAATSVLLGERREWLPSDDVRQLGLLGLTLLTGDSVNDPDWRTLRHQLPASDFRDILQKATGPRPGRYLTGLAIHDDLMDLARAKRQRHDP